MDRRLFLQHSVRAAVGGFVPVVFSVSFDATAEPDPLIESNSKLGLSNADWKTLASAQEHLLPSEKNVPGAKEVSATKYFHYVLNQPELDPEELEFLVKGVTELAELSIKEFKKPFFELNNNNKEKVLRALERTDDGFYWLRSVLFYLLEALLGDPSYGGNPEGIGWQWLDIKPGFPRPTGIPQGRIGSVP
ncbi:MAG: gluconate 2-dehydrogenase subunit 3 family protein [Pseudomonadales bacterium]|nr:gluconate 2-dehydrogenase subunit 3 family protein [Pseudomonadales bacterium]